MTEEDKNKKGQENKKKPEEPQEMVPPLDFSSLFLPFYTQALIKLGQIKDPIANKEDENIDFAKRLIDLLDLLEDRTKGNLKPEEKRLIDSGLQQLKMIYMEKAKIIKL